MSRRPPPPGVCLPADTRLANKVGRIDTATLTKLEAAATAAVGAYAGELRHVVPEFVAKLFAALAADPPQWERMRKTAHELRGMAMLDEHKTVGVIANRLYAYLAADALTPRTAVARVFIDAAQLACAGPMTDSEASRLTADLDALVNKELVQSVRPT